MLSISTVLYCVLPCGEIKMVVILTKCKCTCFINIELCTVMHSVFHGQASSYISDIVTPVTRLPGRANLRSAHWVTATCRALMLDLASDLLLPLALRLGTVYRRSSDVLLWTEHRRRLKAELFSRAHMAFLLTFNSGVSRRGLEGAVRPFGRHLGSSWRRCTASQLVYSCHVLTLSFYSLLLHILPFYC